MTASSETTRIPPVLTARVEAVIGGTVRTSRAIPLTLAGVTLTANVSKTAGGEATLSVTASPPPSSGVARFEKACFERVTFTLFDNDVPIHQTELVSTFQGTTVELIG